MPGPDFSDLFTGPAVSESEPASAPSGPDFSDLFADQPFGLESADGRYKIDDADTIVDKESGKVLRLNGFDSAEKGTKLGALQTTRLKEFLDQNPGVTWKSNGQGKYGREIADLYDANGNRLNGEMVLRGLGRATNFEHADKAPLLDEQLQSADILPQLDPELQAAKDDFIKKATLPENLGPSWRRPVTLGQEFGKGVARGADSLQSSAYGALALVGSALGSQTLKDLGFEGVQRNNIEAMANKASTSFKDMQVGENFFNWAAGALGEAVPSLALSAAGGGGGAMLGRKLVARTLEKRIAGFAERDMVANGLSRAEANQLITRTLANPENQFKLFQATKRGAVAGLYGSSLVPQTGEVFNDIYDATGKEAIGIALLAGGLAAALDTAPGEVLIKHLFPDVKSTVAKTLVKRWLKLAPLQGVIEGSTEAAQEFISNVARAHEDPNYDPLGEDAMDRVKAAAAMGTLVGAVTGTIASPFGGGAVHEDSGAGGTTNEDDTDRPDDRPAGGDQSAAGGPAVPPGGGAAVGAGGGGQTPEAAPEPVGQPADEPAAGVAPQAEAQPAAEAPVAEAVAGQSGEPPADQIPPPLGSATKPAPRRQAPTAANYPVDEQGNRVGLDSDVVHERQLSMVSNMRTDNLRNQIALKLEKIASYEKSIRSLTKRMAKAPSTTIGDMPISDFIERQRKTLSLIRLELGAFQQELDRRSGAKPAENTPAISAPEADIKPDMAPAAAAKTPANSTPSAPSEPDTDGKFISEIGFENLPAGLVTEQPSPIDIQTMRGAIRRIHAEQPLTDMQQSVFDYLTDGRADELVSEISDRVRDLDPAELDALESDDTTSIREATQTTDTPLSAVHEGQDALTESEPEAQTVRHGKHKRTGEWAIPFEQTETGAIMDKIAKLKKERPGSKFEAVPGEKIDRATGEVKPVYYIEETVAPKGAMRDLGEELTSDVMASLTRYRSRTAGTKTTDRQIKAGDDGALVVYNRDDKPVAVNIPALLKWARDHLPEPERALDRNQNTQRQVTLALEALAGYTDSPLTLDPRGEQAAAAIKDARTKAVKEAQRLLAETDASNKKVIRQRKAQLEDAKILERTGIPADTLVKPGRTKGQEVRWRDVVGNKPVISEAQVVADRAKRLEKLQSTKQQLKDDPKVRAEVQRLGTELKRPDLTSYDLNGLHWQLGKLLGGNKAYGEDIAARLAAAPKKSPVTAAHEVLNAKIKKTEADLKRAEREAQRATQKLEREPGIGNKDITRLDEDLNYVNDEDVQDTAEQDITDQSFLAPDPREGEPGDTTRSEEEKTGHRSEMQTDGRFDMAGGSITYSTASVVAGKDAAALSRLNAKRKAAVTERTEAEVENRGGISQREAAMVKEIADFFGIHMKFVIGSEKTLKLHGPQPQGKIIGRVDQLTIMIRSDVTDPVKRVAIIGHELGHAVMYAHARELAPKVRERLIEAHRRALIEQPFHTSREFDEWFADQAVGYAAKHQLPNMKAAAEKGAEAIEPPTKQYVQTGSYVNYLFRQAANKLKKLWERLTTGRFKLTEEYEQFLDGVRSKNPSVRYISRRSEDLWTDIPMTQGMRDQIDRAMRTRAGQISRYTGKELKSIVTAFADHYIGSVARWLRVQKDRNGQAIPALQIIHNGYRSEPGRQVPDNLLPHQQRVIDGPRVPVRESYENAVQRAQGKYSKVVNDVIHAVERRHTGRVGPLKSRAWKEAVHADLEAITKELQQGLPDAQLSPEALKIRQMLAEMRDYLQQAIPDMKAVNEGYFPRVYDLSIRAENHDAFIRMLTDPNSWERPRHVMTEAQAEATFAKLQEEGGYSLESEGLVEGLAPEHGNRFSSQNSRPLVHLKREAVEPFLSKDLVGTLRAYVHQGVRRAEHDRRWGRWVPKERHAPQGGMETYHVWDSSAELNSLKSQAIGMMGRYEQPRVGAEPVWAPAPADMVARLETNLRALRGQLGANLDPKWRHAMGWMMTFQNYLILLFSMPASIPDLAGLAIRSRSLGVAWDAMKEGAKATVEHYKGRQNELWSLGETLGVLTDEMHSTALQEQYGMQYLAPGARAANDLLFKANGLHHFTLMTRAMGLSMGRLFLARNAVDALDGDARSVRYLKELGLTHADITPHIGMDGRLGENVSAKIEQALNQLVNESILRPSASQKPAWGSDPRFMLLFHLKSFAYTFWETIVRQSINETKARHAEGGSILEQATPAALAMLTLLPLAAAGLYLRDLLAYGPEGHPRRQEADLEYLLELVQRTGLTGPGLQMFLDSENAESRGQLAMVGVLGPTFSRLYDDVTKEWNFALAAKHVPVFSQVPWLRDKAADLFGE